MIEKRSIPPTKVTLLIAILAVALTLSAAQRHTLILNGQSTEVLVIFVGGHPYVDLEALANALSGSVGSSGAIVALSLPVSTASPAPAPTTSSAAPAPVPTQTVYHRLQFRFIFSPSNNMLLAE